MEPVVLSEAATTAVQIFVILLVGFFLAVLLYLCGWHRDE